MSGLLLFLVQGIPEVAGLLACSLAISRVELRWGVIITAAFVLTLVIYAVRHMPVTFGLHTVIAILLGAIFIIKATRTPPSTGFLSVFAGFAMLLILETPFNVLTIILLDSKLTEIMSRDVIWQLTGLPQAFLLIAIALVISKYRKPLQGMWKM